MKQLKYKVEAFIVPVGNDYGTNFKRNETHINSKDIHNVCTCAKHNRSNDARELRNDFISTEEESMQNLQNVESCGTNGGTVTEIKIDMNDSNKDETISFCSSLNISPVKYEKLCNRGNICYSTNVTREDLKLAPIAEENEDNKDEHTDFCYHGCKNGCSATVPTPQEVSENIFKETWLQKLEDINRRESIVRSREILLLNREKAFLEKEKQLKALECILSDKLKQIDLQFAEKDRSHLLKLDTLQPQKDPLVTLIDDSPKEIIEGKSDINTDSEEELNNLDINKMDMCVKNTVAQETVDGHAIQSNECIQVTEILPKGLCRDKTGFISSPSSSFDNLLAENKMKQATSTKTSITSKSYRPKSTYDNNNRGKKSCKIYYEDLDTTLSADIGDSSFVQTSQKFNPALYKKPYAFRRTTSERHIRCTNRKNAANPDSENLSSDNEKLQPPVGIEQEKVLQKVTQNIFASQDKSTKFQHYGLIDENIAGANKACTIENEERYSYLNLETSNKPCHYQKLSRDLNRPVSWSEETNEWLLKKRKAYNMTMKKVPTSNKENFACNSTTKDRTETVLKKKDLKSKIFTLFR